MNVKISRKLAIEIGVAAVAVALLCLVSYTVFLQPVYRMRENARWALGKTKSQAMAKMGEPQWRYPLAVWEPTERLNVASSYVPDPPQIDCDEVLIYVELSLMEILYIKNGSVIHVHSCGT